MNIETREIAERLSEQANKIASLSAQVYGPFGLGLMTATTPIRPDSFWSFIAKRARAANGRTWPEVINETHCIRWWGSRRAIEEYKRWADEAYVLARPSSELAGNAKSKGYAAFVAASFSVLPSLTREEMILDASCLDEGDPAQLLIYPDIEPPVLSIQEPVGEIMSFSVEALRKMVETEIAPKLQVDVPNQLVTFKGIAHRLDDKYVLILACLCEAKGHKVSRRAMQERHPGLSLEGHIERLIDSVQNQHPEIGALIKRDRGRGYHIDAAHCGSVRW
jgi:hypothetical protein